jgi:hypothetical protein
MYATLYFGIWEMEVLPLFSAHIPFYCRYIDDCFGLWTCDEDPDTDLLHWNAFQAALNAYGKLEWEFTPRATKEHFLDLDLELTPTGIHTRLYEKKLNLYLYLPPHSAHPPGVLRGLIVGMVKRIFRLTTSDCDKTTAVHSLFRRLHARGFDPLTILPIFEDALQRAHRDVTTESDLFEKPVFLHLPYHPRDVSRKQLQRIFRETLLQPPNEPLLPNLENGHGEPIRTNRMIVAYHRPLNLKNLLFPRRFETSFDLPVSAVLADMHQPAIEDG